MKNLTGYREIEVKWLYGGWKRTSIINLVIFDDGSIQADLGDTGHMSITKDNWRWSEN